VVKIKFMFLDRNSYTSKSGKLVKRAILRHSYRENGIVKNKNIANLSSLSDQELDAIEIALKHKNNISVLEDFTNQEIVSGKYFATFYAFNQIMKKLNISNILEQYKNADIIKWLIFCRLMHQSSVSESFRLKEDYYTQNLLSIDNVNINDFYKSYEYLAENQDKIEEKLFRIQNKTTENIFLYDVTSSYFEGLKNELSNYGYNRDKKKGKKQLVYGLLTDSEGDPISVEAFKGNTNDINTLSNQISKLKKRFNCKKVILVGDKGMIKSTGIAELEKNGFYYITTITKEQIKSKIKKEEFQLSMFENELVDLCDINEKVRYILRKNPVREAEIRKNRKERLALIKKHLEQSNLYLKDHQKSKIQTQINALNKLITKYNLGSWLFVEKQDERNLKLKINITELKETMRFDGCYTLKTNLLDNEFTTENIHKRYKDLAKVEQAFRTEKTAHLEVRPIYLRKEQRTRAHLFIVTLAYKIYRYLNNAWQNCENMTVKEGLLKLNKITTVNINSKNKTKLIILKPDVDCQNLLNLIKVKLPDALN